LGKRLALEAQMAALRAQFEAEEGELKLLVAGNSVANTERRAGQHGAQPQGRRTGRGFRHPTPSD
jgi:hypothetical protein